MKRFEDWPSRLFAFIESRKATPFAWGSNDCCLFACDAILAMTGSDPAASFRGYTTREEAAKFIAEYGTLEDLAESRCAVEGFIEVPAAKAQRGDLVLFDNDGNPALGVSVGGEVAFPGLDKMVFNPPSVCRRAWRVG